MTKEELREHCEKQVMMCEEWAKGNDREPSGKIYEEHKLILDLIKALEQQPSDDCVSRAEIDQNIYDYAESNGLSYANMKNAILDVPPVAPTQKWIPISERLPEEGQRVFVTQIVSERNVVYCTRFPFEKTKVEYITAWQPLPKPYEEKRGNENGSN